jgi:hypothetical protein
LLLVGGEPAEATDGDSKQYRRPAFRERGVKDAATLETLVVKHAPSLEPGLTIVDTGAVLGESTIDLVGIAPDGTLVLIALGLVGDGGMILRALGAYAWCVEYPDAVRQRYRAARRELRWPPRIVFVAEGLPESFVRKVKRLGAPSVECVEFRALEGNGTSGLRFERRQHVRRAPGDAAPVAVEPLADGDPVAEAVIAIATTPDAASSRVASPGVGATPAGAVAMAKPPSAPASVPAAGPLVAKPPAAAAARATPSIAPPAAPVPGPPATLVPEPVRLQALDAVPPPAPPAPAASPAKKGARGSTRRRRTPAWPPTPSMLSAEERDAEDDEQS